MQNKDNTPNWLKQYHTELMHHGVKGQKWGVRNGPPYPLKNSKLSNRKMSPDKFLNYSLDSQKAPDKAIAFEKALGYTKKNYRDLMENVDSNLNENNFVEKGDRGYGMRYENVVKLKGPNGKEAKVLTAWIEDGDGIRLTSIYVDE